MELRQNGFKKRLNMLYTTGKLIFQGIRKKHVAKIENFAFNSYSSPLQRHSPSNIEFLENSLYLIGKYMPIYKHYQHNFCLTFGKKVKVTKFKKKSNYFYRFPP